MRSRSWLPCQTRILVQSQDAHLATQVRPCQGRASRRSAAWRMNPSHRRAGDARADAHGYLIGCFTPVKSGRATTEIAIPARRESACLSRGAFAPHAVRERSKQTLACCEPDRCLRRNIAPCR
jgi:hypothetical protein